MPASEARIAANRANALKSTGPRTPEGKAASRGNAWQHGLTGAGVVLAEADAAEVERKAVSFGAELGASGEVVLVLARRLAVLAVRMERSARQERAAIAEHVRRAEAEFEAPDGLDDEAEVDRLRAEAGDRALFDPSPEATLARKYEAAAERGFFRTLREIRQAGAQAVADGPGTEAGAAVVAAEARASLGSLGSFFPAVEVASEPPSPARSARPAASPPSPIRFDPAWGPAPGAFDVPITIGRAR